MSHTLWSGLTDGLGVVSMIRERSHDSKVNVRKSSVLAMEVILKANADSITEEVCGI